MALSRAHEGYEYQDLISCFFIVRAMIYDEDSVFIIDRKEFGSDVMDDLTIRNSRGTFKKQFKYSGHDFNRALSRSDFNSHNNLRIEKLYYSWFSQPNKEATEFRLCLAWREPNQELQHDLTEVFGAGSFNNFPTKVYWLNADRIWPPGIDFADLSWKISGGHGAPDRASFVRFCDQVLIETQLPKFSLNLDHPGDLELMIIHEVKRLGIGTFPNEAWTIRGFVAGLLAIVKRARSNGEQLSVSALFRELNVLTHFGSIEQLFAININENLDRSSIIRRFIDTANENTKTLILGEPGSGKSWFIENLIKELKSLGIKVIRHYCYTSLTDPLQRERIKTNTFYGNCIADIIQEFPQLQSIKKQKYASNLSELNLLLRHIPEPTYLIIDGLDHIERTFKFRSISDLTEQEIAIIDAIAKLVGVPCLKVVVASQNVPQLKKISKFKTYKIPAWNEREIKNLLRVCKLPNQRLKHGVLLSRLLLLKSHGNPLYLRYLIDNLRRAVLMTEEAVNQIPQYSFNLSNYYGYLMSQLNTREDVPRILAGVSFPLDEAELKEITGIGDYVSESLEILSPILKITIAQGGYAIYHESFRRYIVDELKSKSVSLERVVFQPTLEWFRSKHLFSYRKKYKYYLSFLYESGHFEEITAYVEPQFIFNSLKWGHHWSLVRENVEWFIKAAVKMQDLPSVVILNIQQKILSKKSEHSLSDTITYFELLGQIHGFEYVCEFLMTDYSSYKKKGHYHWWGIKVCHICAENKAVTPWHLFLPQYNLDRLDGYSPDLKIFLSGCLIIKAEVYLQSVAEIVVSKRDRALLKIFQTALNDSKDKEYITQLAEKLPEIKYALELVIPDRRIVYDSLEELAVKILRLKEVYYDDNEKLFKDLFNALSRETTEDSSLNNILEKFAEKKSVFAWVFFYSRIIQIKASGITSAADILDAFQLLLPICEDEGEISIYSFSGVYHLIRQSVLSGLYLLDDANTMSEAVTTLITFSLNSTGFNQRYQFGPLTFPDLMDLVITISTRSNSIQLANTLKPAIAKQERHNKHLVIADLYFNLAKLFYHGDERNAATQAYERGIQFLLAAEEGDDHYLDHLIDSIPAYFRINPIAAKNRILEIGNFVKAEMNHNFGDEFYANPYITSWFEYFVSLDFDHAGLFLLDRLCRKYRSWDEQICLINFLIAASGTVNPEVEFYLLSIYANTDANGVRKMSFEQLIPYLYRLKDRLAGANPTLEQKIFNVIFEAMRRGRKVPDELVSRFNDDLALYGCDTKYKAEMTGNYRWSKAIPYFPDEHMDRTVREPVKNEIDYFIQNKVTKRNLPRLISLINTMDELDDPIRELLQTLSRRDMQEYMCWELDSLFTSGSEIACYYFICRFVDSGPYHRKVSEAKFLQRASQISYKKAFDYLFERLASELTWNPNFSLSVGLINSLSDANLKEADVKAMWEALFSLNKSGYPGENQFDWERILTNKNGLNNEERMICMLISIFKGDYHGYYHDVLPALYFLFEKQVSLITRPVQWLLDNREHFPFTVFAILMQFIGINKTSGGSVYQELKDDILPLFPTNHFAIDQIIGSIYHLNMDYEPGPEEIYPELSKKELKHFLDQNIRYKIIHREHFDIKPLLDKAYATYLKKDTWHRKYEEALGDRAFSEMFFELLNKPGNRLPQSHKSSVPAGNQLPLAIDIKSVVAYRTSFGKRPNDLSKAIDIPNDGRHITMLSADNDWIRIAHFERELRKEEDNRYFRHSFGGAVNYGRHQDFPSPFRNQERAYEIWGNCGDQVRHPAQAIIACMQQDPVEYFKILWLDPFLMQKLRLKAELTEAGLTGVNASKECVLRFRAWPNDYEGDDNGSGPRDEITKLFGVDLIMRTDYFHLLCQCYSVPPEYFSVKKTMYCDWKIISNTDTL